MNNIDNTELIEAFLNNELGQEERAIFENRLQNEADLQEEVALHKQIKGFVKQHEVENLKSQVKTWLSEEATPKATMTVHKTRTFTLNNIMKIAAAVVIVSGMGWYLFTDKLSGGGSQEQYLSELVSQNPTMLQGSDDRSFWTEAFRNKNYQQVIDSLEAKPERTPEEAYHLGLAYTATKNYPKAIEHFSSKIVQDSVYSEKANWAIALIYLEQNNKAKAKSLLEKIAKSDSEFAEKAKKLLE